MAEDGKLPVIDFDFKFVGDVPLQITVWPTMDDVFKQTPEGWFFEFPRLGSQQWVYKHNMLGALKTEGRRKPFSMEEFKRKMEEAQKAKKSGEKAS